MKAFMKNYKERINIIEIEVEEMKEKLEWATIKILELLEKKKADTPLEKGYMDFLKNDIDKFLKGDK